MAVILAQSCVAPNVVGTETDRGMAATWAGRSSRSDTLVAGTDGRELWWPRTGGAPARSLVQAPCPHDQGIVGPVVSPAPPDSPKPISENKTHVGHNSCALTSRSLGPISIAFCSNAITASLSVRLRCSQSMMPPTDPRRL